MPKFSNRDVAIVMSNAVEQADGSYINKYGRIAWYNDEGALHREDGPAIIHTGCGSRCRSHWWLYGINYSFNKWLIKVNKTDEEKMILRLQYG
jgi:hypothetical protein